nr:hypothetical protein [Anaerolineae bacterium]
MITQSHSKTPIGIASLVAAALVLSALACNPLAAVITPTPEESGALPTASPYPSITPTVASILLPTPLPPPLTPTPEYAWLPGEVRVFPGAAHYPGDLLTIEVAVVNISTLPASSVESAMLLVNDDLVFSGPDIVYSPLRENALIFRWAWDTTGLPTGPYRVAIIIPASGDFSGQRIDFVVNLDPETARPLREQDARWVTQYTPCCVLRYITDTAAERDIDALIVQTENAITYVEETLGLTIANKPIPITFIDNIWGNGAYASGELVLSYIDRAYTTLHLPSTLRHEAVHWAMRPVNAGALSLLSEGIAVYVAGGHFKEEPIPERAAALVELGYYVPLAELTADFWSYQHETAYLEAAGLVAYLVQTHGLESFIDLYAYQANNAASEAEKLNEALLAVYNLSLEEVEVDYLDWLAQQYPGDQTDDLRLTIELFNTIRRYQMLYAPYQESLPPAVLAAENGQVGEFLRESTLPFNVALEAMLVSANNSLLAGDYVYAERLLAIINSAFDDGNFTRELLVDYVAIAALVSANGYEAQEIDIAGDHAVVLASPLTDWPTLETLTVIRDNSVWQIVMP